MITILVCLVLVAFSAEANAYAGPSLYTNYQGEYAGAYDNYVPKPYAFEYGVSDPHTGDHKSQWETKDEAGVVRGSYSLLEPDGSTRIVDYIADDLGFRAVVKKIGLHGHPESIQSHGGEVLEAPLISPIVVAEPGHVQLPETIHLPESVPEPIRVNYETPLPVEAAPLYHSYDGGLEHYQNLYNTQPLPFRVPEAQGAYVELPQHQFGDYIHQPFIGQGQIGLDQPGTQQTLFAPSQPQSYVPQRVPQGIISSKIDDLEPQYGPPTPGGYQVPQYVPQQPQAVQPVSYNGPELNQRLPDQSHGDLPVDNYRLELAYGQPNGLSAPKLILGGQESIGDVPNSYGRQSDIVGPSSYASQIDNSIGPNSYVSQPDNGLGPRASYEYVQEYGRDGTGDLRLNQGEYLPPDSLPVEYGRQGVEHK